MATGVWGRAQDLLRQAADIIEERSAGRDEDGRPDTIALAALAEGMTEAQVLAAMVGIKRIRLSRGQDHDSAIDMLAYEARRIVSHLPQTDPTQWGPAIDPPETFHGEEAPMPPHLAELIGRHEGDDSPEESLNFDRPNPINQDDEE